MGPTMEPHVRGLLDPMFFAGFSVTLVDSLELLSKSIPPLLPTIHNRLLEMYLSNPFKIPSSNVKTISCFESRASCYNYPPSTRTEWFCASSTYFANSCSF